MNYEEAIVAYNTAIEIDPMAPEPYIGLANIYIAQGDYEQALAILKQGAELIDDGEINSLLKECEDELNRRAEEERKKAEEAKYREEERQKRESEKNREERRKAAVNQILDSKVLGMTIYDICFSNQLILREHFKKQFDFGYIQGPGYGDSYHYYTSWEASRALDGHCGVNLRYQKEPVYADEEFYLRADKYDIYNSFYIIKRCLVSPYIENKLFFDKNEIDKYTDIPDFFKDYDYVSSLANDQSGEIRISLHNEAYQSMPYQIDDFSIYIKFDNNHNFESLEFWLCYQE